MKLLDEIRARYNPDPSEVQKCFWVPADLTIGQANSDMAKLEQALRMALEDMSCDCGPIDAEGFEMYFCKFCAIKAILEGET